MAWRRYKGNKKYINSYTAKKIHTTNEKTNLYNATTVRTSRRQYSTSSAFLFAGIWYYNFFSLILDFLRRPSPSFS